MEDLTKQLVCQPTGPRLGRIRGELDDIYLRLGIMREAATLAGDRALSDYLGAMWIEVGAALRGADSALERINNWPPKPKEE